MRNAALLALLGIAAVFASYAAVELLVPLSVLPAEIRIEKGMSFSEAAGLLKDRGVLRDKGLFIFVGRLMGIERKIRPGYYLIPKGDSPWDLYGYLRDGDVVQHVVTVVEGDSLIEIRGKLAAGGVVNAVEFDALVRDEEFVRALGVQAPSLEGYLFPDTYGFPKGATAREVLRTMVDRLREVFNRRMLKRSQKLGLGENGALTLASIIEKEAVFDSERAVISGVFHNRLKKDIPLQADPTAIYGVRPFSEGVFKSDVYRKTQYNTYTIKGLPPGPIASPGLKSIKAALYPADVPYLYFVSDANGGHRFSTTLKEHLRAVREYKNIKRKRNRSARRTDTG